MERSLQRLLQGRGSTDRRAERLLPFGRIARAAVSSGRLRASRSSSNDGSSTFDA